MRSYRNDHAIEFLPQGAEVLHRRLQTDVSAARAHVVRGRLGKQAREITPRQQQIARSGGATERVAQHGEENIGRSELGWRVERRDAERPPQVMRERAVLPMAGEELADCDIAVEAKARPAQRRHEARGAQALAERYTARGEQTAGESEGFGQ